LDRYERAKMAGAISVLADVEMDPIRKTKLENLITTLKSGSQLSSEEEALIAEIESFTIPYF